MVEPLMRSALFVPGNRPDRFDKARASGADAVIVDLEDAVAPDDKVTARAVLRQYGEAHPDAGLWVRINDGTTRWFEEDLAACRRLQAVAGIILPKAAAAEHVYIVSGVGKPIIPGIESAAGLHALESIAAANGVARLSFGILDLLVELGTRPDTAAAQQVLDQVRFQILVASRMHGLAAPLDSVFANLGDLAGLARSATLARDLGFGGMLCVHPTQVPVVHQAYREPPEDRAWAQRVLEHVARTGEYTFRLDEGMVDLALIERARRIAGRGTAQEDVE